MVRLGIPALNARESPAQQVLIALMLQGLVASLVVANPDGIRDLGKKYLSIADLSGVCCRRDGLHGSVHHVIRQDHFNLDLRNQVHRILAAAINLGVTLLPPVASGFEHRHAFKTGLVQRIFDGIQLRRSE